MRSEASLRLCMIVFPSDPFPMVTALHVTPDCLNSALLTSVRVAWARARARVRDGPQPKPSPVTGGWPASHTQTSFEYRGPQQKSQSKKGAPWTGGQMSLRPRNKLHAQHARREERRERRGSDAYDEDHGGDGDAEIDIASDSCHAARRCGASAFAESERPEQQGKHEP